ncbi:hypothetical protein [Viridibacterium curvum]|uniref:Uncharacterized protein n=1 Tax=Viridibacterium curvum TaxID=1101404 RepID=A0ABP9R7Q3_9RHOO
MKTCSWLKEHKFSGDVNVAVDRGHEMLWLNVGQRVELGYPLQMPGVDMFFDADEGRLNATFPAMSWLSMKTTRAEAEILANAFGVKLDETGRQASESQP